MEPEVKQFLLETLCGYSISLDGKAIFCRLCGHVSHNPNDVENRYCGYCHLFHDSRKLEEFLKEPKP